MTTPDPLASPERVAFAGCWHGDAEWALLAVHHAAAQGASIIVHTGDFGYLFTARFVEMVNATLRRHGIALLFVDGNHDDHAWINRQPLHDNGMRRIDTHIWYLPRGYRWCWDRIEFLALGGAHSVDWAQRLANGWMWSNTEAIQPDDVRRAVHPGPADVMVCHDAPWEMAFVAQLDDGAIEPIDLMCARDNRQRVRLVAEQTRPAHLWHGHHHLFHQETVDWGWGFMDVTGLDGSGSTLERNVRVVPLHSLRRRAAGALPNRFSRLAEQP